jgi:ATPase subunit of ABC transporter with duplicated ATPase domains
MKLPVNRRVDEFVETVERARRILADELIPDAGTIWREPGLRAARLVQDAAVTTTQSVFDVVAEGLGDLSALVRDYHHATIEVAERYSDEAMATLEQKRRRFAVVIQGVLGGMRVTRVSTFLAAVVRGSRL